MSEQNESRKKICNLVRKLLYSNDISVKEAAMYLNCTEQSFRNKLSRDSFSLRDLIILCHLCNAQFTIEYFSPKSDHEVDFLNPSDYLSEDDYERIRQIEHQNFRKNFENMMLELSKDIPADELAKLSPDELLQIMIQTAKEKLQSSRASSDNKKT